MKCANKNCYKGTKTSTDTSEYKYTWFMKLSESPHQSYPSKDSSFFPCERSSEPGEQQAVEMRWVRKGLG